MRDDIPGWRIILLAIAIVLIVVLFWRMSLKRFEPEPAEGVIDVDAAGLAELLASDRPGILEFYTKSCPYCVKMEPELARLYEEYGDTLFIAKMNASTHSAEASLYKVPGVPTLIYFNSSGEVAATGVGYRDFEQLVKDFQGLKLLP